MQQGTAPEKARLVYFDYFRAIAIILIVIGHCYVSWHRDTLFEVTIANMITGGTAFFVFISGFFLHAIFYRKFDYQDFMIKKTKGVLLPYLVISSTFMATYFSATGDVPIPFPLHPDPDTANWYALFANYFTGRHLTAYWYIPFAMLLFAASPLFIAIMQLRQRWIIAITALWFGFSMVVHRPEFGMNPPHSLMFYGSFYLFGIVYSMNRRQIDEWISQRLAFLIASMLALTLVMAFNGQTGSAYKYHFHTWNDIDLMVPQKVLMILVLLGATMRMQKVEIPALRFTADISFAIFFIHPIILFALATSGLDAWLPGGAGFVVRSVIVLGGSVGIAVLLKSLLEKRSRYVIGY